MIIVGLLVIALGAFFRYTDVGIAVRASAENGERASLLGIPVKRVSTIVWMLAKCSGPHAIVPKRSFSVCPEPGGPSDRQQPGSRDGRLQPPSPSARMHGFEGKPGYLDASIARR